MIGRDNSNRTDTDAPPRGYVQDCDNLDTKKKTDVSPRGYVQDFDKYDNSRILIGYCRQGKSCEPIISLSCQNSKYSKFERHGWHLEVAALAHGTVVFATTWLLFLSCASFCAVPRMKISCFLTSPHCLFQFLADNVVFSKFFIFKFWLLKFICSFHFLAETDIRWTVLRHPRV